MFYIYSIFSPSTFYHFRCGYFERIDTTLLNLANMVDKTTALGPGTRAVIWVQGCNLHCPGCIAPDWIPFKAAIRLSPEQIVDRLLLDEITGLTLSGGEPMEQASPLAEVVRLARQRRDLDVICFTGYRYETLLKKPVNSGIPGLLQLVDVLVDGPYIREKNNSLGLRGSANQRIIYLTEKLRGHPLESQARQIEFRIDDGFLTMVGIPTPSIDSALTEIYHAEPGLRAYYERS
jgi:anaerobic ribonucleoside-triphosphate reductase activating protein